MAPISDRPPSPPIPASISVATPDDSRETSGSGRSANRARRRREAMLTKAAQFAVSFLGAMLLVSGYDRVTSEVAMVAPADMSNDIAVGENQGHDQAFEEPDRPNGLRGSTTPLFISTPSSGARVLRDPHSPAVGPLEARIGQLGGCGRHRDEASCSTGADDRGHDCVWCTDHRARRKCVADDSMGYAFAPCNNWICYDEADPSKSDVSACERV